MNKRQAKKRIVKKQKLDKKARKALCSQCQWGSGICFYSDSKHHNEHCNYYEAKDRGEPDDLGDFILGKVN